LLSAVYGLATPIARRRLPFFISLQICIDAISISFIVFVTGGYASVFSFLYLVVVIYSSVFVYKRGTLLVALFCSLQFILLLVLEFYGHIDAFWPDGMFAGRDVTAIQVFQKSGIMTVACFSVALLSGYLSDQERKSKAELAAMEVHLDRVQNLAQIGEMAAGLAHEIKNPLASLSGAIQILKGEIEHNADNERLMHIVLRETDRLSSLVNNFLTFARPSAGQTKPVDLGAALKEIVTLFEKNESMVQVELTASEDTWIEIDPMQLRQVIWNLLLNGVESIESEGTVRIRVQKRKSGWAVVEIADNGCGMDENTVKAIFNPFYTTKPNGTGLGLSIVYRILETYGCRMDVRSTPGSGSVFTLFFQLIDPTKSNR
jgi:two-component system sensor histidine kinase PilS (NtrC family)